MASLMVSAAVDLLYKSTTHFVKMIQEMVAFSKNLKMIQERIEFQENISF